MALSYDGNWVAIGCRSGRVGIGRTGAASCVPYLGSCHGRVNALAFSTDGTRVVSDSADGTMRLWLVGHGGCRTVLKASGDVAAVADGLPTYPILACSRDLETYFVDMGAVELLALYGTGLANLRSSRGRGLWAGSAGNQLHVLAIEQLQRPVAPTRPRRPPAE